MEIPSRSHHNRELRELKQPLRRGEGDPVVGADGLGQAAFVEQALKGRKGEFFPKSWLVITDNSGVDGDKRVYEDLRHCPLQTTLDQRSGGPLNWGSPSAVVSSHSVC